MNKLPSVEEVLKEIGSPELPPVRFLKPAVGKEIEVLYEQYTHNGPPQAKVLALRMMILKCNSVIPFHVHEKKEKVYDFRGPGTLLVVILINGDLLKYYLKPSYILVIPAGCPHCVIYFPGILGSCKVFVVSSSQDGNDIRWEERADELVKSTP